MVEIYYSELLPQLAERSKLASISRLGFANIPLRRHLAEVFTRPYGQRGSFLADPTFEAVFGWKAAEPTIGDLAGGLLTEALVDAMNNPPEELANDYRFDRKQHPYQHQLEAWKILSNPEPQSLVATSGTGSGKTECFMVPILDRLIRLKQEQGRKLVGVRALFLYPLNALINSQRERLRAWTQGFGGDIRFCLYNGNTPYQLPAYQHRDSSSEVLDRERLWASPPPILVTNATMLEYMLVRTRDAPILEHSQGILEWVVLDEAHNYIGSQAAEIALLIRRVLLAFGVSPEQVRFVATSATIGSGQSQQLKTFLAQIAGVDENRVHVVTGERYIPLLDAAITQDTPSLDDLCALDAGTEVAHNRYAALAAHPTARRLRDRFVGDPGQPPAARLSEVCRTLFGSSGSVSSDDQQTALRWLDVLSGTHDQHDTPLLPLRAHLFHQTLSGLWACADRECPHRQGTALDHAEWPFGTLFFEPRQHCACGSPVYEVVSCGDCGSVHLQAGLRNEHLLHLQAHSVIDEFELEIEPDNEGDYDEEINEENPALGRQSKVLVINRDGLPNTSELFVQRDSRRIQEGAADDILTLIAQEEDVGGGGGLTCPVCQGHESPRERLMQPSRIGAPFLLGGILPTLLEYAPDGIKPAEHPHRGRRLLTFNDSRQGTARIAAKLQQDSERNRVRGLVYHLALQLGQGQAGQQIETIRREIDQLEQALRSGLPELARRPLESMLAEKQAKIDELAQPIPIRFDEMARELAAQGRDFERMLQHYRRVASDSFGSPDGPLELARMFLVREFGRRPKRLNSLETMGLVAVRYPALDVVREVPPEAKDCGFTLEDWRSFLKVSLDFFVRGGGSLDVLDTWRHWLGMPMRRSWLVERDQQNVSRWQRRWPRARRSWPQSILVRLLVHVLNVDIQTPAGEDRVDSLLLASWAELIKIGALKQTADGLILPLDQLAFAPISKAWICPVTRRFLDTTLRGITPYLPRHAYDKTGVCEIRDISLYDKPFGGLTDELERIQRARTWLLDRADIAPLREEGLWSNLNDRVIELQPYFTAAEHSAQQDSQRLAAYERAFRAGDLNLLSCSTTMEMGIDIGGIAMVAMNNVPPHPANYLQRAGRAGRRGEMRSTALTLCKSNPHDQAVFANSRWAFDTRLPVPSVMLHSAVLVQRHVNALLLGYFLAKVTDASEQDRSKLNCAWFFVDEPVIAEQFSAWCMNADPGEELTDAIKHLVRHSLFEGISPKNLLQQTGEAITHVTKTWVIEWDALCLQENETLQEGDTNNPAHRAVLFQKGRMGNEYLLRELATQGFLPAHGFPSHITAFDNLTVSQFKRMKDHKNALNREDNRFRRRELPSRDRVTALREYAPGSEIVIDGLVYRSAGITLNWHIPATEVDAREIQSIRFAWRCSHCGGSGSSHGLRESQHCSHCGENIHRSNIRQFLTPSGFAVDFYANPHNDVTTQSFVPVEPPWIDANGDWFALPNPALGRFRVTDRGHMFHQSNGIHGAGYAICLACGRTEPMPPGADGAPKPNMPVTFTKPHSRLRGTHKKGQKGICPGSHESWKIKPNLALGHETHTDVLEIQIKTLGGAWLNDPVVAMTLAVALRDALAELLGVQATELGCDTKPALAASGGACRSILIYDRFAAGYASSAERFLSDLFGKAREQLQCRADCDSACPQCILDFDQRFAVDNLNRHAALEVVTEDWLHALRLPDELTFFGQASRLEYSRLSEAVWRTLASGVNRVRLFADGQAQDWDVGPSPLRELAYCLAGQQQTVELLLPDAQIAHALEEDRYLLASLADHPRIKVIGLNDMPRASAGRLLIEMVHNDRATRWAVNDDTVSSLGIEWGTPNVPLVVGHELPILDLQGHTYTAHELRPQAVDGGDRELIVHHELDGKLQGFGTRFWTWLADNHPATHAVLEDEQANVNAICYSDRYLFAPLAVALLVELIDGLRELVTPYRWAEPTVSVITTDQRQQAAQLTGKVWSDWPDMEVRNNVLTEAFDFAGINADLQTRTRQQTPHGRTLTVEFSSGLSVTVRLDQGVSYWRASAANQRYAMLFDFGLDPNEQGGRLAEMTLLIEGASHPTELFIKVR